MDPEACLQKWRHAQTYSERHEFYTNLANWLASGGFEPAWSSKRERSYWKHALAAGHAKKG